ncbi:rsbT co-antagonist protein RsbR [Nocardiopsis arvandica]|jgi:rsbT co-antagonist protein RsbR|uniref:RsbT co-antagonist protein RsbR n=1 Tax=Nocardiopsis sinuspersici TaxID=501010 RepID=A0A7Y9XA17_9ACTN|nr:STAS domain-containing protein [Nocardiopsis sinuspersici]NYH51818.1 rsbT co-antagonist protein RsbR [Nocardiopsis sinuspersici]
MTDGATNPAAAGAGAVADLLRRRGEQIAQRWADLPFFQTVFTVTRDEAVEACHAVVDSLAAVAESGRVDDLEATGFQPIREQLVAMTASRARSGLSTAQVDREVGALREAALELLAADASEPGAEEAAETRVQLLTLFATLRVLVVDTMLQENQEIVLRQREQLLEMATPVIKLWDRLVAVPLIGMLDSARSQVVMENLLEAIVEHKATIAILDITGVSTVDSLVAHHLMKTVASARLMGAECVISGIRPAIAQTIVQLGLDLGPVTTRASLADALEWALERRERKELPARGNS